MPELGTHLREYLDATAPPVELEQIITDDVWIPAKDEHPRPRLVATGGFTPQTRSGGVAIFPGWAYGVATMAAILLLILGLTLLVPGTDRAEVVDEPVREEPVDQKNQIEPAGSGPPLVWDEVDLPMDSRLGWLVVDDQRFFISMTDSFEVTADWSWFVSDDARTWAQIPSYKELLGSGPPGLDLEPDLAWNGKIVSVDFPTVITVDTTSAQVASRDLDLDTLLIDDPCFQPVVVGAPESQEIACEGHDSSDITAGPEGILIVAEAADIPNRSVVCPEVNPGCDPTVRWPIHPIGWISTDGVSWTPLPQDGPFTAGAGISVDIAAVEDGFVAIRSGRDTCEAWYTPDGSGWQQVGSITVDECPTDPVIPWRSDAIGVLDSFWFGPSPSVQPAPFWLISSSGISQLENEPMPPIEGTGNIAAGEAGIAVVYGPEASGSDSTVAVIEYSQDGIRWSRRALPDGWDGSVVVGSEEVVIYGSYGVDGLLVGRP